MTDFSPLASRKVRRNSCVDSSSSMPARSVGIRRLLRTCNEGRGEGGGGRGTDHTHTHTHTHTRLQMYY